MRRATVSGWECGKTEPRPPERDAYARLLDKLAELYPAHGWTGYRGDRPRVTVGEALVGAATGAISPLCTIRCPTGVRLDPSVVPGALVITGVFEPGHGPSDKQRPHLAHPG
ncbi:hypothetical protein GCM10010377_55980 [Streptomyces viridiviolaceus]|nr:hypothetical protein GCM10010377_55980 [Streptomyces viridiviolaceus]